VHRGFGAVPAGDSAMLGRRLVELTQQLQLPTRQRKKRRGRRAGSRAAAAGSPKAGSEGRGRDGVLRAPRGVDSGRGS
jgi:ribosome assembly protein YihI (activator of Der GTPase)